MLQELTIIAIIDPITQSILIGILMAAISLALSEILRKPPEIENARPANLGDFKFPTATEGRVVPIVFGTVQIKGPNVVWWGDFRQVADTEKIKTSLFSSKKIIRGYEYFIGFQAALCRGPIDLLTRVWIGDSAPFDINEVDGTEDIIAPKLFGGNDFGTGGIEGTLRVKPGTETQTTPTYLDDNNTPSFPYRGTCYALWEGGYIGNSTTIKPWSFEVQRFPNSLGLTGGDDIVNVFDANPAAVIFELLTDTDWGFGRDSSVIDVTDLRVVGATLAAEGNGFSFIMDMAMEARDFLGELERQIDGTVFQDPLTGLYRINLVRGGFDVTTVAQITDQGAEKSILDIPEFSRGSWEETFNQVRINYANRDKDYKDTFELAEDLANLSIQGEKVIANLSFPGVKNKALASNLASRELRSASTPLAKVTVVVDRKSYLLTPNQAVAFTSEALGFTQLPMRVAGIDRGDLLDGRMTLTLIQDTFEFATGFTAPSDDTLWFRPVQNITAIPAVDSQVFEAPRAFTEQDDGTIDRIWAGGRAQTGAESRFGIFQRNDAGTPSGAYKDSGDVFNFLLVGTLGQTLLSSRGNPSTSSVKLDSSPSTVSNLFAAFTQNAAPSDIGQSLVNLIRIDNEFLGVSDAVDQTTFVDMETVYSGLLDTVVADHSIGAKVYLLFAGGGLTDDAIPRANNVDVQLRSESRTSIITEGAAAVVPITMADRARRPYPPATLFLNGVRFDSSIDLDDQRPATSGFNNRGIDVFFIRKDFRKFDEILNLGTGVAGNPPTITDAEDVDSTFPLANVTRYKTKVIEDPGGSPTTLFETAFNAGEKNVFLSRTKILRENAGTIPANLRVEVTTEHAFESETFEATDKLAFDFGSVSTTLANDTNMGVLAQNVISSIYTVPIAGPLTATLRLGSILSSGDVEARVNGGSFSVIIASGLTSGTILGLVLNDTIEVRHTEPGTVPTETFLEVDAAGTTVNGYAILTF